MIKNEPQTRVYLGSIAHPWKTAYFYTLGPWASFDEAKEKTLRCAFRNFLRGAWPSGWDEIMPGLWQNRGVIYDYDVKRDKMYWMALYVQELELF